MFSHLKLCAVPQPAPPVPKPPKHLINVSAGTGKTRAAIAGVVRAVKLGMRVVIAVPTTSLGLDIHHDIEKLIPERVNDFEAVAFGL
jgi:late competence protein required for DNA uptake (superfamily II DNA/RNA helicase)